MAAALTASMVPTQMLVPLAVENTSATPTENSDDQAEGAVITAKTAWGMPGNQAKVVLTMENNPGIVGMTLQLKLNDSVMSVTSAENGTAVNGANIRFTPPASGSNYIWTGTEVGADEISDGTLLTLTLDVKADAKLGEYPIEISCTDAVNNKLKQVPITVKKQQVLRN